MNILERSQKQAFKQKKKKELRFEEKKQESVKRKTEESRSITCLSESLYSGLIKLPEYNKRSEILKFKYCHN